MILDLRKRLGAVVPLSAVGMDGGDLWYGVKASKDDIDEAVTTATSTTIRKPIISQYYPDRRWLWRQWGGTIVRRVLPRDVLFNIAFALLVGFSFQFAGKGNAPWRTSLLLDLASVQKVWTLAATMVSFTLSFFLSQAYTMWRTVYSLTRRVQGRLNDIGLLCSVFAQRDPQTGRYTPEAEEMLRTVARYVRLFNMLFYASVTTRFAPLKTPQGLSALVAAGALTQDERDGLLESSMGHNAVVEWLSVLFDTSVADGRLGVRVARNTNTSPIAVQMSLQNKVVELRMTYAAIPDELAGRMPLAYVQLVQILSDMLIFFTPFALLSSVGGFGAVCGTAIVTLFHSSIVNLAKNFLDPFSNEADARGKDAGVGGISVATLLQETNVGSERWRNSASWVPEAAWHPVERPPPASNILTERASFPRGSPGYSEVGMQEGQQGAATTDVPVTVSAPATTTTVAMGGTMSGATSMSEDAVSDAGAEAAAM